ncbi:MAG: S8 family serine peptidase [bacterium]
MNEKIASFFIGIKLLYRLKFLLVIAILILFLFPIKILSANGEVMSSSNGILVKYKNILEVEHIEVGNYNLFDEIEKYKENQEVEYAEPNYTYKATIIPSDISYDNQWYLTKIKAARAWDKINDTRNIVIAIIDSGVDIAHPDLQNNIWKNKKEIEGNFFDDDRNGFIDDAYGWDFVNNVPDPSPKFEEGFTQEGILHGTIVAGVAAAEGNNKKGVVGVTWHAQIMALKVLNDKGEGDTRNVIRAIDYAIANGADIINFSFIGSGYSKSLEEAIKRAYQNGIIIVAAAGNEQGMESGYNLDDRPMYPVCYDGNDGENMIIGVAATDTLDQKAVFSGYGKKCIDISAPGVSIFGLAVYAPERFVSGYMFNRYYDGYWSGTSMAVPMVSAAAALVSEINPSLDRNGVIKYLQENVDDISRVNPSFVGELGAGRLNLSKAVSGAEENLIFRSARIITAPMSERKSQILTFEMNGNTDNEFMAYGNNFFGGASVATGDIDGDEAGEIITGAGFGGGPHVRIFNRSGELLNQFFAYDKNFRGGVNVAAGDVDGDGVDEIIAGAGRGGSPQVRIFEANGRLIGEFFVYDKNFRGGVNVAAGDVDGDGVDEIITGAGFGGGPQVRIFEVNGELDGQFFAYDKNFRGGVNVATANFGGGTRDRRERIITAPGKGANPEVKIFDNHSNMENSFFAYNKKFQGGVSVSSADINRNGYDEIITGAGPGGAPHVMIFENDGKAIGSFYAHEESFNKGVNVAGIVY